MTFDPTMESGVKCPPMPASCVKLPGATRVDHSNIYVVSCREKVAEKSSRNVGNTGRNDQTAKTFSTRSFKRLQGSEMPKKILVSTKISMG